MLSATVPANPTWPLKLPFVLMKTKCNLYFQFINHSNYILSDLEPDMISGSDIGQTEEALNTELGWMDRSSLLLRQTASGEGVTQKQ